MIKVSVFYPHKEGGKFDMDYYCKRHMALVQQRLGAACKKITVDAGLSGAGPQAALTYTAMGHLYFDSAEAFQTAFAPHAKDIMADVPNYTDIQPIIQISEVKM